MIFDENGLPKPTGADDFADSAHLAGILVMINHHDAPNMIWYCTGDDYIRHTSEKRYDDSRDACIMIMCALLLQNKPWLVRTEFIHGKDLLSPAVHGLETIARTGKPTWLQSAWFKLEMRWQAFFDPMGEPFQEMIMACCYGKEYVELWAKLNPLWELAVLRYFRNADGKWRKEPILADDVIWFFNKNYGV